MSRTQLRIFISRLCPVYNVDGTAADIRAHVLLRAGHDALTRLLGRPAYMRGDDAVFAVSRGCRPLSVRWTRRQTCGGDLTAVERVGKILFYDSPPRLLLIIITPSFIFRDAVLIYYALRLWEERAVQRDDIGAREQFGLFHVLGDRAAGFRRAAAGSEHRHAQRLCDAAGLLAYAPEADYAERLAVKLDERIVPETPVLRVLPAPLMHGLRVVRNVMAYLEQHRYGKLRDGGGAVGRDVADRYAASLCVFIVDDVIARRSDGDIFKGRGRRR